MPPQLSSVEGEIARVRRHCGFRQSSDEDGVGGTDRDGGSRTAESRRQQELSETVVERPARQRKGVCTRSGQVRGEIAERVVPERRGEGEGLVDAASGQRFVALARREREAVPMALEGVSPVLVRRQTRLQFS